MKKTFLTAVFAIILLSVSFSQPVISEIECSETNFMPGASLEIQVREESSRAGLSGTLTIRNERGNVVLEDELTDEGGVYYALWKTPSTLAEGYYAISANLLDEQSGTSDDDGRPVLKIYSDLTPPKITKIESDDPDNKAIPGTLLKFQVYEENREIGLEGVILIEDAVTKSKVLMETLTDEGDGTYTFLWKTAGIQDSNYTIKAFLTDRAGNQDDDGRPSLTVVLNKFAPDDVPPWVGGITPSRTLAGSSSLVEFTVKEGRGESGLEGTITIIGEDGTVAVSAAALEDKGNGIYAYKWRVPDNMIDQAYHATALLKDAAGNANTDSPEAAIIINDAEVARRTPLLLIVSPQDGTTYEEEKPLNLTFKVYDRVNTPVFFCSYNLNNATYEIQETVSAGEYFSVILHEALKDGSGNTLLLTCRKAQEGEGAFYGTADVLFSVKPKEGSTLIETLGFAFVVLIALALLGFGGYMVHRHFLLVPPGAVPKRGEITVPKVTLPKVQKPKKAELTVPKVQPPRIKTVEVPPPPKEKDWENFREKLKARLKKAVEDEGP